MSLELVMWIAWSNIYLSSVVCIAFVMGAIAFSQWCHQRGL